MKKLIPFIFILVLGAAIYFVYSSIKKANRKPSSKELAAAKKEADYFKAHYKEIGTSFIVDSIAYKVASFEYVNTDTVLKLNILLNINNSSISNKTFGQNAFSVQSEDKIIFYPTHNYFTIQPNQQQQIKLNFNLPKLKLPYALTDLRIISNTDSTNDSFVRLLKNYKAEG
jgi:hypothetical protein